VQARLGLSLAGVSLTKARHLTLRYVLVNEFRSDLGGQAPGQLDVVPAPPTKEEQQRVRDVAERLRREHPDAYSDIADGIERELNLPALKIDADALGTIDTFRFEEAVLVEHAAKLIADAHYERSFWTQYRGGDEAVLELVARVERAARAGDLALAVADAARCR